MGAFVIEIRTLRRWRGYYQLNEKLLLSSTFEVVWNYFRNALLQKINGGHSYSLFRWFSYSYNLLCFYNRQKKLFKKYLKLKLLQCLNLDFVINFRSKQKKNIDHLLKKVNIVKRLNFWAAVYFDYVLNFFIFICAFSRIKIILLTPNKKELFF